MYVLPFNNILSIASPTISNARYTVIEFNVPLDTVYHFGDGVALSSDVHLSFSNGGPAAT